MGILDEAIREHLELKRQHGAGDSELKKIEDDAFGPADRPGGELPDAVEEPPTEFLDQAEAADEAPGGPEDGELPPRREGPSVADLQEAPESVVFEEPPIDDAPAEEQATSGHSTAEREAIAEQPTEMFDVEDELAAAPAPSDEELLEEEISEPRLAPSDPLAGLEEGEEAEVSVEGPAPEEDEDDEFWNEQRLSDELDQALEAPLEDEPQPLTDEHEAYEAEPAEPKVETAASDADEDVLEETPDFLEETPEDDQLWFEQKPPKDFDFDD
jgi:hypothetical protein